ncbi:MAG: transglutaminase domain-containing protein, partial [Gemmatimonadetes bacterium]|nr:transglutaminase domain-containing protein [Gemmatimonadota bacterium]
WRASLGRDGRLLALAVRRAGVEPEQQVSVRFDVPVAAMQPYSMTTWVSTATDAELMEAGEDYPAWVTDRYLQLPETLPERVRTLAEDLVERAGSETPFEKTMALAEFLGSQVYSQEIAGPERGQDGVDYFLFETVKEPCPSDNRGCDAKKAKGYSQYFGSALTVMLRSVGVPARMVAGFGPGEFTTPSGAYVVRGSDRHGWSQVFFPGYGWIDVEATPGASQPTRGVPTPSLAPPRPALGTPPGGEDQTLFEEDLAALEELLRQARMRGLLPQEEEAGGWPVAPVAGGLSGVAGAIVAGVLVWVWGLRGLRPAERAYARVVRLGSLVGLDRPAHYTPREYGALLSDAMPSSSREVGGIVARYEAQVYGRAESGGDDAGELERMWRRVRGAMLGWRLRNLLGVRTVPGPVAPVRSPE